MIVIAVTRNGWREALFLVWRKASSPSLPYCSLVQKQFTASYIFHICLHCLRLTNMPLDLMRWWLKTVAPFFHFQQLAFPTMSATPPALRCGDEVLNPVVGRRVGGSGSSGTAVLYYGAKCGAVIAKFVLEGAAEHEARMLAACAHPHVVPLMAVLRRVQFRGEYRDVILMAACEGGDMGYGKVPWLIVFIAMFEAVCGLHYVHRLGISHNDLKGLNILRSTGGIALLGDFGSAQHDDGTTGVTSGESEQRSTLGWRSGVVNAHALCRYSRHHGPSEPRFYAGQASARPRWWRSTADA